MAPQIAPSPDERQTRTPLPPLHTFEFVVTVQAANRRAAEAVLGTLPDDVTVKEVTA